MANSLWVCLALLATANAGPARFQQYDGDSYSCALKCKSNPSKFQYRQDTTYIYDYSVDTETSMAGASEDTAKLSIQARAEIQVIDSCEFALTIKDVRVSHSQAYSKDLKTAYKEEEFRRALERNNLRFAFDDGVISSVCPSQSENTWALNFKRGLLSAFQNSMEDFNQENQKVPEVDVTGECEAEYSLTKSQWGWNKVIEIQKSKNLLACSKRDGYKSIFQNIPYKVHSEIQSLPIMKSTHKCQYSVTQNRVLRTASCEESHVYVPFSNGESGGKTTVQQKLNFISQRQGVDAGKGVVGDRRSMLFQHVSGFGEIEGDPESAQGKLKQICEETRDDIRPETPRLFTDLVDIFKGMDKSELQRLYRLVKDKSICPSNDRTLKFFMDALPMAGSSGPVQLMAELIERKEVDSIQAKAWIASLILIQEPSSGMIGAGLQLLQGTYYEDSMLPVSAMVNNYCKKTKDCADEYSFGEILSVLENKIPSYCSVSDKNLMETLKTLRAIGNIGQTDKFSSALKKCLNSNYAPLEVRVAAADAYRRLPCGDTFDQDDELWSVLKDSSSDDELRIVSYLSIMRCPNDETLNKVSQLLEDEEDGQVGSFIYSHLRNLKETSDPLKQSISKAVSRLSLKEFEFNPIQNSHNYEASFLINKLNMGLSTDADVIMSSKAPLPRSARANLTVDLFGSSINVFEIGARIESLEYLVEKILGPYGYFPKSDNSENNAKLNDVKGSLYARVFGNEILYHHVKGADGLMKPGKLPNFLDLLITMANKQKVSYTHSQQLMDLSLIIPTVAGLPLNMSINGSLSLDLKAEGKADLRRASSSPRSLEIDGELQPSAAMEITGTMAVDAFIANVGLRMRNTMHSSTAIKGHIEINRGRELSVEIEPPKHKMEIFSARSQFFIIHNEEVKEQRMIEDNRKEHKICTGNTVAKVLGVQLCGELQYPNASAHNKSPYFPFTGPSSVSIMTYKKDRHSSYKLFAKRVESKQSSNAQFLMNTPGSKINRMISTDVTIDYQPDKKLTIAIVSPWKKLNVESVVLANSDILSLVGNVLVDDSDKYGLTTEVKISKDKSGIVYTPFVEVTSPEKTLTILSGQVEIDMYKKAEAKLELQGLSKVPYNVKAILINQNKERRLSLSVSNSGRNVYLFNAGSSVSFSGKGGKNVMVEPEVILRTPDATLLSITGSGEYKNEKSLNGDITVLVYKWKPMSLTFKALQMRKPKQDKYTVDLNLKTSLISGRLGSTILSRKNMVLSKFKLTYNIPKVGKDSVTGMCKITDKSKKAITKYDVVSNLNMRNYPDYNTGWKVRVEHKKKYTGADLEIKYGRNPKDKKKTINLVSSFGRDIKGSDLDLQISAQAPEKDLNLDLKMSHTRTPKKLDSKMAVKFEPFLKNDVEAGVRLQDFSNKMIKYVGQGDLQVMGKKMNVQTDLVQKSANQYKHTIDVNDFSGRKHSIDTVYRMPGGKDSHEIISDVNLDGMKTVKLEGRAALDFKNFKASASAAQGSDVYSVSTRSKISKGNAGRFNLDIVYPQRQIEVEIKGNNDKDRYDGGVSINWDAPRKNKKSMIIVSGAFQHRMGWDSRDIEGEINVQMPFRDIGDLSADITYQNNKKQCNMKGTFGWNGKGNKITSTFTVQHPLSFTNALINFATTTPFKKYRQLELEVEHKIDTKLFSALKGKVNDEKAELTMMGESNGNTYNRDIHGSVDLKTPFKQVRKLALNLQHQDDSRKYTTAGSLEVNGRKYEGDLSMDHSNYRNIIKNKGDVKFIWPEDSVVTTWDHNTEDAKSIRSSLTTTWGRGKSIVIKLDGTNDAGYASRHVKGNMEVKTPWRNSREIILNIDHAHESAKLDSSVNLHINRIETAAYEVLIKGANNAGSGKFLLKSPLYDYKIQGQSSVNFRSYPATGSAWLEWAPRSRVAFDGSLNAESFDNIDVNTKLTTPFRDFENIIVKASHKLEDSEYISHANIDYGVRKMIEFENRLRYDDVKLLRTTLTTPYPYMRSLETGIRLVIESNSFNGNADFELQPLVEKYDGHVSWDYDSDFNGKLEVNTPHKELPSLKVSVGSKIRSDSSRASHIEVEPSPYGVYTFDTTYRTNLPYHLDMSLKTPHPEFDNVGLTISYKPSSKGIQSTFRVEYLPDQEINSQLNLDWDSNIEGNLVISTPFYRFEKNEMTVRHDFNRNGFTSHGEVHIGRQDVVGDVSFLSRRSKTSGSAMLNSPIPGYEKIEGNFEVNSQSDGDIKGSASLELGSDGMKTVFSHKVADEGITSSFALYTPYTEDLKLILDHKDKKDQTARNIESSVSGHYGVENIRGEMSVNYAGLNKLSGMASISSSIREIGDIEVKYEKNGSLENMDASAKVTRNSEPWMDTRITTDKTDDEIHGQIITKGKLLPTLNVKMDHKGGFSNFNTKTRMSGSGGNVFDNEITFKIDGTKVDVDGHFYYKLQREDHTHTLTIHKEGTLRNFKVDISKKCDGEEIKAKFAFDAENNIKGLAQIDNLLDEYDLIGGEFEHSGDLEKFLTTAKVYLSKDKAISSKVNFYLYEMRRIEVIAELMTPWEDYKFSKFEYRHEGEENKFTCNTNVQYGDNQKMSSDLTLQRSPDYSISLIVKTPFKNYEDLLLSGSFDSSKINAKVILRKDLEFTLSGIHDSSIYPYHPQYMITTPFPILKKAVLNLNGETLDGTVDLVIRTFRKKIEANGVLKYNGPFSMTVSAQLESNIKHLEQLKMLVQNSDDAFNGQKSHIDVSWYPQHQIVVDGVYFAKDSRWTAKKEHQLSLDIKLPIEILKTLAITVKHNAATDKLNTKVDFEVNEDKLLDVDLSYEKLNKEEISATFRKPRAIEVSASRQIDDSSKEGDIFVNWNRDDPSSNIRLVGKVEDSSTSYETEQSHSLKVIRPSRTMGAEHKLSSSSAKISSSGKVFWDDDDDSKLSYSLAVDRMNRRGGNSYNGQFELGLPSRTLGVSGSVSDNDLMKKADAAFSWDMGRDDSKRLGLRASLYDTDYTKADISVELPADVQLKSEVTLNQGNTIFDGKTDISYSRDSRKTLTLFSRVKNSPSSYRTFYSGANSNFNYSVEFGISHPETKVDVKIDSHVGKSSELLTSSVGVQYLTNRRQMKNMALFTEIDKIKKQISLLTSGPSSNIGVRGQIVSEEPLNIEIISSVDGEEKLKSTLDVDTSRKTLNFEIGQSDNLLTLKAFYPNNSALEAELYQKKPYSEDKKATMVLRLAKANLLHCSVDWKPEVWRELKDWVLQQTLENGDSAKLAIRETNAEIKRELAGKYRIITASIVDEMKPKLTYLEDELNSIGSDIDRVRRVLKRMHSTNEFHFRDISEAIDSAYDSVSSEYIFLETELAKLSQLYRQIYKKIIQRINENLEAMKEYSLADAYQTTVSEVVHDLLVNTDELLTSLIEFLKNEDLNLLQTAQNALGHLKNMYNNCPKLEVAREKLQQLRDADYGEYVDKFSNVMSEHLQRMKDIDYEPYKQMLTSVKSNTVDRVVPYYIRDATEQASLKVYEEAKWAYNYWAVEENIREHMKTLIELLKEIIEDEIKEVLDAAKTIDHNPVTVFDVNQGRFEADLPLPIALNRLDQIPDLSPYYKKASNVISSYTPNLNFSQYSPSFFGSNETADVSGDIEDFNDYKPNKSMDRYLKPSHKYRRAY